MEEPKFETIGRDHPVSHLANELAAHAHMLAGVAQISKFDVCVAMANACGLILADAAKTAPGGKPLPRDKAIERMNALRTIMESAYDLRDVKGAS